ncbi:MAG: sigma-54-dependent Fis family transcriptional regulator [Treponema sp.]|nr:sigma-54-dependent Fis family transcriptional regulator [Candidatus Treponema equi]
MVAEEFDCPFFTIDSWEDLDPSEFYFLNDSVIEDNLLEVQEPSPVFSSAQVKSYKYVLEKYALQEDPILLLGESGVGKTYAAKIIHEKSLRKGKPFISCSIADFNPFLIESELFGCVKGAYTDAVEKAGIFEMAQGGILFLDELGELSLENQAKFLGVLTTGKFSRVGSHVEIPLKCRLVFATDADLKKRVLEHTFSKQLYWRIEKFTVTIPPLRERRDEIRELSVGFAKAKGKVLSEDAIEFLERQDWPGNIRQLKSCIERSAALCDSEIMSSGDLFL